MGQPVFFLIGVFKMIETSWKDNLVNIVWYLDLKFLDILENRT